MLFSAKKELMILHEYLLSKGEIFACRRVAKDDMEKISKATKAKNCQ